MAKKKGGLPAQISSTYSDVLKKSKSSDVVKKLAKLRGHPLLKGKSRRIKHEGV